MRLFFGTIKGVSIFKQYFFLYTLAPLLVLVVAVSYVRFMVLKDYTVGYEGDCDQYTESCFIGTDEDTGEEYYYSKIQKYAPNIESQCGQDITDCNSAQKCLPEDGGRCSIMYCDPAIDTEETCEILTEEDIPQKENADSEVPNDTNLETEEDTASSTEGNSAVIPVEEVTQENI